MTKELKFTMKEVKEQLILAVGEAFARLAKTNVANAMTRPVKMKDWLGEKDTMIPDKLDYSTEEDWISVRITWDDKYTLTYFATDDFHFSVTNEDYFALVHDFLEYFFAIYKA